MEITEALKIRPEVIYAFPWHHQHMGDENDDTRITFQTSFIIMGFSKQAK